MQYLITVIVPIYNSEMYLTKTLDSLCNQTIFEYLEIILVNDGSTDNSYDICKQFSKKYLNFKVINQNNKGVSEARNAGLKIMTGKYVTFLDADDIIDSNLYEKQLNLITKKKYDIAITDFTKNHADGTVVKYRNIMEKEWSNKDDALNAFFMGIYGGQVVDKLFSYDVVKSIVFPKDMKIGEDMWFVYQAIKNSCNIVLDTSICGYHYIVRESSAMTGDFSKKFFDPVKLSYKMYKDCEDNAKVCKYAEAHFIHETCKVLEYIYRHSAEIENYNEVLILKKYIRNYKINDARKYLIKRQFFGFVLMRISPKVYMIIHKIMHVG